MYHKVIKLCLLCFIGFISYGQGKFQNFPNPDSVDCNSSDFVLKVTNWYNSSGGGTIAGTSTAFSIQANKSLNSLLSELGRLQDKLCEKDRKVNVVFSIINQEGVRTDSVKTYFKINDDGIRAIRNPDLNRRDTCFDGVEQRMIVWLNNGGNGQIATFCSGPAGWTDFIFNGSDGSSGSGRVNLGPYPRIPSNACGWTLNVTFFAQDSCGNRRGFPGRYLVIDNQPPVLDQVLKDLTVSCHQIPDTVLRVKDACDRLPVISYKATSSKADNADLCSYYNYRIDRQWIVTDRCGNKDTFQQNILVSDVQGPVITLPGDLTVSCNDTSDVNKLILSVKDNCSNHKISYTDSVVRTTCVDLIYRTYTAEDICKNISSVRQRLYIQKSLTPVIINNPSNLSFACNEDFKNIYKNWLETKGGLKIEAGCTEIRYRYGLKKDFSSGDTTKWNANPPDLADVLNEKSDTAFYIIAYTDCGASISVPVIKSSQRKLGLIYNRSGLCTNDTLTVRIDGVLSGDTIIWTEHSGNLQKDILTNNVGLLSYKLTNSNTVLNLLIKTAGCGEIYKDSIEISKVFKNISLKPIQDITICEGEKLTLNYTDTSDTGITWITPAGNSIAGKSSNIAERVSSSEGGIYKYFGSSGNCISDTLGFLVKVNEKPKLSISRTLYEVCSGSEVILTVNSSGHDSLFWFKDSSFIKASTADTLLLTPLSGVAGNYIVFAKKSGCLSDNSENIIVKEGKNFVPEFDVGVVKCEGDTFNLLPVGTYENISWVLPSNDTVREESPVIKAVSGDYVLISSTAEGCKGMTTKKLTFNSKPQILNLSGNYSKCDTLPIITLSAEINKPDTTLRYTWIAPDNSKTFNSKLSVPKENFIFGSYGLLVSSGECLSDTAKITINRDSTLNKIDLKAPVFYCDLDTVNLITASGFDRYRYLINGKVIFEGSKPEIKFVAGRNDTLNIQVEAFNNKCLEGKSELVMVLPGVKPSKPVISNGVFNICLADSLRLNVNNPDPDLDYVWMLPTGAKKEGRALRIIDLPNNIEGLYKVRAIRGTCLSELSDSVKITVKPRIEVPDFAQLLPPVCDDGSKNLKFCLKNVPKDTSISYQIRQIPSQKLFYEGKDTCYERAGKSFEPSTSRLRLYALKDGCISDEFKETNVNITIQPEIKANIISESLAICQGADSIKLFNEKPIDTLQVIWRVFSDASLKILPNNQISLSNLSKGRNRVILTISYLNCRNYSSDTLDLVVGLQPKVKDTTIISEVTDDVLIPLLNYDSIGTYYFVEFSKTSKGEVVKKDGKYYLRPNRFFSGTDTVNYIICFGKCSNECKNGQVIINFTKEISCDLPNIITPNGDGVNDAFIVACSGSDEWGSVDFLLFDQWGNEVYRNQNYQNDFEGRAADKLLASDTYYYIVKPSKTQERITGFLIIKY
jgi:gliding motility-associated-like protein